jgi:hypothetical protein
VVAFTGRVLGGEPKVSDESTGVRWVHPGELPNLTMHDSVRLRLRHHQEGRREPYLG